MASNIDIQVCPISPTVTTHFLTTPIKNLSPQEARLYKMYGKIPTSTQLLNKKIQDRKYFDSGDYALSKAGKVSPATAPVGSRHPNPDTIPHSASALRQNSLATSPRRSSIVTTHVMNASDSLAA